MWRKGDVFEKKKFKTRRGFAPNMMVGEKGERREGEFVATAPLRKDLYDVDTIPILCIHVIISLCSFVSFFSFPFFYG